MSSVHLLVRPPRIRLAPLPGPAGRGAKAATGFLPGDAEQLLLQPRHAASQQHQHPQEDRCQAGR